MSDIITACDALAAAHIDSKRYADEIAEISHIDQERISADPVPKGNDEKASMSSCLHGLPS